LKTVTLHGLQMVAFDSRENARLRSEWPREPLVVGTKVYRREVEWSVIAPRLLDILVCPETHMRLELADDALVEKLNVAIQAGHLVNRVGHTVAVPLNGGLLREDREVLYPIVDGIPVMLIEEAILLDQIGLANPEVL
jgi:uncharacterized protein